MMCLAIILFLFIMLVVIGNHYSGANWGGYHLNWVDGVARLMCRYLHRLPPTSIDLPEHGAALVAANHVSGLDPLLLIAASPRPLRFMIALDQYQNPILNWLYRLAGCIPVDRKRRPEVALRAALKALEQGEVIALFPHGGIHLNSELPKPIKAGVARLALWSGAPIYPVRIDGVKAEGEVLLAPFVPSRAKLTLHPFIRITEREKINGILAKLQNLIEQASPN